VVPSSAIGCSSQLQVYVVFTSLEETRAALKAACELVRGLKGSVTLLVAQVVPYPMPLDSPPVAPDFTEQQLRNLAAGLDLEIGVQVYLCRDREETIRRAIAPDSIVVIGKSRRRWFRRAKGPYSLNVWKSPHIIELPPPQK
jgi:hypothetical protein